MARAAHRRRGRALGAGGRLAVLVALALAALNLRPALSSISPLLGDIRADLALSGVAAGALTALPVLCMGVFAPVAAALAGRLGIDRTMALALAIIGVATAARVAGDVPAALFLATAGTGLGIAIAQTLVPAAVKERFGNLPGLPTGVFVVFVNLGAVGGASLSLPLAHAFGDRWEPALAAWGLLAAAPALLWWQLARRRAPGGAAPVVEPPSSQPLRDRRAWAVTALMATLSLTFYIPLTWYAAAFEAAGQDEGSAALMLTLFIAVQVVVGIAVPSLAGTPRARRAWLAGLLLVTGAGLLGTAFWRDTAPALWALLTGVGVGGTFPLGLILPVDHTATPRAASRLTAMMFTVGYLIAAAGPVATGALHDATGDYALPFALLAGLTASMAPVAWLVRPRDHTSSAH